MALVGCSECSAEISDKAAACPKCGNPMRPRLLERTHEPPPSPPAPRKGGWLKWVFIIPVGLFALMLVIGALSDRDGTHAATRAEADRRECLAALTSSMGHSTVGYADKAAYDARVREKCQGFEINGKALGQ